MKETLKGFRTGEINLALAGRATGKSIGEPQIMPYITQEDRRRVLGTGEDDGPRNPGELNYLLTKTVLAYMDTQLSKTEGYTLRYQVVNDVIGALEGAKLEFYRRCAAPYEDIKIRENGDVY